MLTACGGKTADPLPAPVTGRFLDAAVEGLKYRTATLRGTTDANGSFSYRPGERVTFSIGGMDLPEVAGAAVVTPLDVAGTSNLNDPKVVNLLVLLQSLDQNANPSDGIKMPAEASLATAGTALAQALTGSSAASFASSVPLRALLNASVGAQRAVVGAQAAIDHFAQTLASEQSTLPFVSKVTLLKASDNDPDLAFDRPLRLRFEGRNLASGITASATGACTAMTPAGNASSSVADYTCTPSATGSVNVALKAGTRTLYEYSGTVRRFGVFDGPVQGLGYRTASQSGTTDASGRFAYLTGETVTFSIGGMNLSAAAVPAAAVVTPLDIAATGNLTEARLVNLLVLLQSIDEDGNPAVNGIRIPDAAAPAAAGSAGTTLAQALSNSSAADFAAGAPLRALLNASVGTGRAVVGPQAAIDRFAQTLATSNPSLAFVSKVTMDAAPAFDSPVRWRFEGRNLSKETLTASATGACTAIAAEGSATGTAIEYACTPVTIGALDVTLAAGARTLHVYKGNVPAPSLAPRVVLATSLGPLTLELDVAKAPVTSINFLRYVNAGFYTNTVFHRVLTNFMVQGGGFFVSNNTLRPKSGAFPAIALERTTTTGLSNVTGTVAMARTDDPDSATSQFFINTVDNLFLNTSSTSAGYAVFGRVVEGDATVQLLRAVPVQDNGGREREVSLPLQPPVINLATRVR